MSLGCTHRVLRITCVIKHTARPTTNLRGNFSKKNNVLDQMEHWVDLFANPNYKVRSDVASFSP